MSSQTNSFLVGPRGPVYARTALPIVYVRGMNGRTAVAAPLFLGHFAGARALAAMGLIYPRIAGLAAPLAEALLPGLTALVLARRSRARSLRWGLFQRAEEVRAKEVRAKELRA